MWTRRVSKYQNGGASPARSIVIWGQGLAQIPGDTGLACRVEGILRRFVFAVRAQLAFGTVHDQKLYEFTPEVNTSLMRGGGAVC